MPLQILVTDDDSTIQNLVKDCLELEGYSVILANDGEKALSLAMECHPHLLISDIKMPHKDGYQLVQELRNFPPFRLLPVIFLTQQDSMESKINGYEAGCDVYLGKPFEPMELIAIVKHLLERSQIIQAERLFNHDNPPRTNNNHIPSCTLHLTQREKEVLALIIEGLSNVQIAHQLYLSPKTIEKYVANLLKKTDSQNRTELVAFAFKNHLTS
ncbi:response regulator transcription factor [Cyanobacterium stanieri LEGE 03274]|uniref:Response regulator transcription factor n=1 Tax=Cyanobacterium stanieri LEGE 03274 TaxID=1828756 RepID=A0ABR9V6H1_9CHRO|nr:response regulator transcription factor [Cyanobacterium stanieri]MBE9222711.1 response regulator transcription factor [Cyanobacterium stanieri LEGE 03274]